MRRELGELDVRAFLDRMAAEIPLQAPIPPPEALRRARRSLTRTVVGSVVVSSLVAVAAIGGVRALTGTRSRLADEPRFPPVMRIPVDGEPAHIAIGEGSVWTAGDVVVRIDPGSGRVVSQHRSESRLDGSAIAVGEGYVWVSGGAFDGEVIRIDPGSGRVDRFHTGQYDDPFAVATGAGWAWAIDNQPSGLGYRLIRIDPMADEDVLDASVDLPYAVEGVTVLNTDVWLVAAPSEGRGGLIRVDAATPSVSNTLEVDAKERIVAGFGSIWTTSSATGRDASILRIDPTTGSVVTRIAAPAGDGERPAIAVGDGAVWIGVSDGASGHLLEVDPETNEVVRRLELDAHISAIAAEAGAVWVVDGEGSLLRVDAHALSTA